MRDSDIKTNEFEVLPTVLEKLQDHDRGHEEPRQWVSTAWNSPIIKNALSFIPLILAIIPVVLLLAYSRDLSESLGANGCTPSGDFVIPFTTSIWNPKRFFSITIAFLGPYRFYCSFSATEESALACLGYSFTQVKVIDIAWDILVGRGGQAILILIAYRIFSRIVKVLMQQGEVGYDLFSAVAFNAGRTTSFLTIAKHALGATPVPRTRRAVYVYAGMTAATLYIVSVQSLLGAMTGYTSYSVPLLEFSNAGGSIKDCNGAIVPVWGQVEPTGNMGLTPTVLDSWPVFYDGDKNYYEWNDYYSRYKAVYEACPVQLNISTCPQAHRETYINARHGCVNISSPMPGIVVYANSTTAPSKYSHWMCAEQILPIEEFDQYSPEWEGRVFGICRSGSTYAWGFSYLMTFVTSVLNLLFTLVMYALWFYVKRHGESEVGEFKDAVTMVTLAQRQYGTKIAEWSSSTLQKEIVEGRVGMSFAEELNLRKRNGRPSEEVEFGDPRAGDWGGVL